MATYKVFDPNMPILDDCPIIEAKTGIEAVKKHIKVKRYNLPVDRLIHKAGRYVLFSATQIMPKVGRQQWYGLKPETID